MPGGDRGIIVDMPKPQEITPYVDDNHCVFYGLQEANIHFNKKGLSAELGDNLKEGYGRRKHLWNLITGDEQIDGGVLLSTLPVVIAELKKLGIGVKKAYCSESTKGIIQAHATLRRFDLSYKIENGTNGTFVEFPIICFYGPRQPDMPGHVWFAGTLEDYQNKIDANTRSFGDLELVLELKKLRSRRPTKLQTADSPLS